MAHSERTEGSSYQANPGPGPNSAPLLDAQAVGSCFSGLCEFHQGFRDRSDWQLSACGLEHAWSNGARGTLGSTAESCVSVQASITNSTQRGLQRDKCLITAPVTSSREQHPCPCTQLKSLQGWHTAASPLPFPGSRAANCVCFFLLPSSEPQQHLQRLHTAPKCSPYSLCLLSSRL